MEKWLTGGRFRTTPSGVEKWFTDLPKARIAMEAGTHSIWHCLDVLSVGIVEFLQEATLHSYAEWRIR
jgi:hypothetical protein